MVARAKPLTVLKDYIFVTEYVIRSYVSLSIVIYYITAMYYNVVINSTSVVIQSLVRNGKVCIHGTFMFSVS